MGTPIAIPWGEIRTRRKGESGCSNPRSQFRQHQWFTRNRAGRRPGFRTQSPRSELLATLFVYLDQTGGALAGRLRPGNAGANTAQDHVELLDAALQQLPLPTRAEDPELGLEVLVRSDSAGASHGFVGAIAERGLEFSVGFDVTEPVREAILQRPEGSWEVAITKELEEREGAEVAEIT
ncbi:transposase IS4 family protein, partial [mine drainage metagenome]